MENKVLTFIVVIFIVGTGLRLLNVNREFLGHFGSRQIYDAWVVRNFVREGINIRDSKLDVLDHEGKKTPNFRDFPLLISLTAFLCRITKGSIEFWGRFLSVIFYVGTFLTFYYWLRLYFDLVTLFFILFVFSFFPNSIIYSQSFVHEGSALFFFCLGVWLLENYFKRRCLWGLIAGSLCIGISFATRTQYIVLVLSILYLFYREWSWHFLKRWQFYSALFVMMLVPVLWQAIAWRLAVIHHTMSSLAVTLQSYGGIGGGVSTSPTQFSLDIYKKIIDDLSGIVFNPIGFSIIVFGVAWWKWEKKNLFFIVCLFSMLLAIIILPQKFYKHDYYYFPILLGGSVFAGYFFGKLSGIFNKKMWILLPMVLFILCSLRYSLHPAFKTPDEQIPYLTQSKIVQDVVPNSKKVVIVGAGAMFLYYCDRMGWTISLGPSTRALEGTTVHIVSKGKVPQDHLGQLKFYESLGAEFVILYDVESKIFDLYLHQNYQLIKRNDYISIYKKMG